MIERPNMIQEPRNRSAVLWDLQRQHARTLDPDIRAVQRVVIDEYETVQAKTELGRKRFDVFRFAFPIDTPRDQVLAFQNHVSPPGKDIQHILFAVLAAQT